MVWRVLIRKNEYYDSVFLMRVAQNLMTQKGIIQAILLMGTDKNKELLSAFGFQNPEIFNACPNDLIVALQGEEDESLKEVITDFAKWLQPLRKDTFLVTPKTLAAALRQKPQANLAVISVPGPYAAKEASQALKNGLHVFLLVATSL